VEGCDVYQSDNDPSTHYCPVHNVRMVRDWDERVSDDRDQGDEDEDD
jgi:hypothetical protein